jgi:peptidylprolyl isomerase
MRSDAPAFAAYTGARANRRVAFFVRPAGAVDLCNAPVPVRHAP